MKITATQAVAIGVKIFAGVSTGYFVYKATEEKTRELVYEGNMLTAFTIGAGQTYLALMAGQIAFWIM